MSRAFAYHQTRFRHAASTVSNRKYVQQDDLHQFMYPLFLPPSRVVDQTSNPHCGASQFHYIHAPRDSCACSRVAAYRTGQSQIPRQSLSDSSTAAPVPVTFP